MNNKNNVHAVSDIEDIAPVSSFFYENAFYLTAPSIRIKKLLVHYELFKMAVDLPGDIVECGVFKGASLSRFAKFRDIFQGGSLKKVVGFDVFGEFPLPEGKYVEDDAVSRRKFIDDAGAHSITEDNLMQFLENSGVSENIDLIKGDISKTIPEFLKENPGFKVALLNIDLDLYKPTFDCLRYFYGRVSEGGIIILDDYNGFPGATKAIDEFFKDKKPRVEIKTFRWASSPAYIIVNKSQ